MCKHDNMYEFSVKEVSYIFHKNYRTILLWLNQNSNIVDKFGNLQYKYGKFPNAYKCKNCGKIFIPMINVSNLIKQMKEI